MAESWTHHRSRLANLSKTHNPNSPEIQSARRDLKAARLEDHVAKAIASAPPLTDEQLDRIASLLRVTHNRPQAAHADQGLPDADHERIGGDV